MTFQPTHNLISYVITIFFVVCCLAVSPANSDSSGFGYDENAGGADCAIDKTPLSICKYFSQYMKADKSLNYEYKQLTKILDKKNIFLLKQAQRLWIEWRDEKSGEVYEKAIPCAGTVCIDAVHDNCVIDLTNKRTEELRQFKKDTKLAKDKSFSFSKEYVCQAKWGPRS